MAKKLEEEVVVEPETKPTKPKKQPLDLEAAIARHKRKMNAAKKKLEDAADAVPSAEELARITEFTNLFTGYLADAEEVEIGSKDLTIKEVVENNGHYLYTIWYIVNHPTVAEAAGESESKAEGEEEGETPALPKMPAIDPDSVWVKNVSRESLEADTFPYRWTGKHKGIIKKFDDFVGAVTFAKIGFF